MSYSEQPAPPETYSDDAGPGTATATDPRRDATRHEQSATRDNAPQDAAPEDTAAQDTAPQDTTATDAPRADEPRADEPRADADAADDAGRTSRAPSDGQLRPGAKADDPVAALWGADLVEGYRDRWQALQLSFVDDPHAATQDAARLVDEAVQSLTSALGSQKQSLDEWQGQDRGDTEVLRTSLQNYREFLDRLLGM
jgi:hypothetical protein